MHVTYVVFIPAQSDSIFILFHPCRISCHGDAPAGGPTTMWINGRFSTSNYARSSLWIARCDAPNASNWRIIFFQVPESMKNERAFTTQYPFVSVKNRDSSWKCWKSKPLVCFRYFQEEVNQSTPSFAKKDGWFREKWWSSEGRRETRITGICLCSFFPT